MSKTWLLKRVEGLELWTSVTATTQHFAVKTREKRLRVANSLAEAEAYLAAVLAKGRIARSH